MINQPLLDFIRQQLQVGSTKEKISSDLLANGWNSQDIEEGFKAINIPILNIPPSSPISSYGHIDTSISPITPITSFQPKTHSGKKVFSIVLVLFLLVGGASVYYFKDDLLNSSIVKDLYVYLYITPSATILPNDVETPNTTQQPEVPAQTPVQTDNTQAVTPTEQPTTSVPDTTSTTPTLNPDATPVPTPTPTPTATEPAVITDTSSDGATRDAIAKKDLKKATVVAEPYYDKADSYAGFCASSEYANAMEDVIEPTTLNCKDSTDEYSITASMSDGGYWCVDNVFYNNKASFNTKTACVK